MELVCHFIYPPRDTLGHTFFNVTVWQTRLEIPKAAWGYNIRVLDARMVINGQIVSHKTSVVDLDQGYDMWLKIIDDAKRLVGEWKAEFKKRTTS